MFSVREERTIIRAFEGEGFLRAKDREICICKRDDSAPRTLLKNYTRELDMHVA